MTVATSFQNNSILGLNQSSILAIPHIDMKKKIDLTSNAFSISLETPADARPVTPPLYWNYLYKAILIIVSEYIFSVLSVYYRHFMKRMRDGTCYIVLKLKLLLSVSNCAGNVLPMRLLLLALMTAACSSSPRAIITAANLNIIIPDGFPTETAGIRSYLYGKLTGVKIPRGDRVEVLIYGYSSGKEIFSMSEKTSYTINNRHGNPHIEALVKHRKGNALMGSYFLEISETTTGAAMARLSDEIKKILLAL